MLVLDGEKAYKNLEIGIKEKRFRFPSKKEPGGDGAFLLPNIHPRFTIGPEEEAFTIGSCFARVIEKGLRKAGFSLPVSNFSLPAGEYPISAQQMLNEYNVGTILQRVESVFGLFEYLPDMGIEEKNKSGQFVDLFLNIGQAPVSYERLIQRRQEIEEIYYSLLDAPILFITLGLIEAWYDKKFNCYLNKAPSRSSIKDNPDRFFFHRMDIDDVYGRVAKVIDIMNQHAQKKILLTVSPIPIEATFSEENAIVANAYSKSVLRVACQMLREKFSNVDYFPSYEIALSGGIDNYKEDNVHLGEKAVNAIVSHFCKTYLKDVKMPTVQETEE